MPGRSFITKRYHWGVDAPRFWPKLAELIPTFRTDQGVFSADAMVAWGRTLGFLEDEAFTAAWDRHAKAPHERGIIWRTAVLVWAARQALRREGGFVECGCYAGTSMRIVLDTVDVGDRPVYLYDLFEHDPSMVHHAMPDHGPELFAQVQARFAEEANVHVIRGAVPDSFAQGAPDAIAFCHIDMNNAPAETAALDALEPRFAPGCVIVFDDYGQLIYQAQHVAHRDWFGRRGLPILEIPTGQGVVIW
jgi:O-methyltransferase